MTNKQIRIHSAPENSQGYDLLWNYQHLQNKPLPIDRKSVVTGLIDPKLISNKSILDLCCGRGRLTVGCYQYNANNVTCVDGSYSALEDTQETLQKFGHYPDLVQADIEQVSDAFEQNSFDVVLMLYALQHQKNEEKTIADMATLVKPKGYVAFTYFGQNTSSIVTIKLREIFLKQSIKFSYDFLRDIQYLKLTPENSFTLSDIENGTAPKKYDIVYKDLILLIKKYGIKEVARRLHLEDFTTPYIHNTSRENIGLWTKKAGLSIVSHHGQRVLAVKK